MSVAVVSFNTRGILERCLESVASAAPEETVVVDNASTDGSQDLVRTRFPSVSLIANEANRGYGAAANQGVAACSSPAILLLNSDTIVPPAAPRALGRYLAQNRRAAVAGPRLVNEDGKLQGSAYPFPSALDTLLGESGAHLAIRCLPLLRESYLRTWSHDVARPVPWVLGAALAIRRDAFEAVGGFDESFFMYGEEVDLCRRLAAAGFETHYAPVVSVTHIGASSTSLREAAMYREFLLSRRRYLLRHESRRRAARALAAQRTIVRARLARDLVRLRLTTDGDSTARLRSAIERWRAVLDEEELWRP